MITLTKIHQLEKQLNHTRKGKGGLVLRDVTQNCRPIDKDGFVFTREEIKQMEKENKKAAEMGDHIVWMLDYREPKLKPGSVDAPYKPLIKPNGEGLWGPIENCDFLPLDSK